MHKIRFSAKIYSEAKADRKALKRILLCRKTKKTKIKVMKVTLLK